MQISRPWAFWRRTVYGSAVGALLLLLCVGIYFAYFNAPPTCFDGKKNGDERGVDCGGVCTQICTPDVEAPRVIWADAFSITDTTYNAVAYVENRNIDVGTPEVRYTFTFFDERGTEIATRQGTTFLPPDSVYPIFEGRIDVGGQRIARTFLTLESVDNWRIATVSRDAFEVRERTLQNVDSTPRLDTTIFNTTFNDEEEVEVVATIFDRAGNALTASRSIVDRLPSRNERNVVFTWPEPIAKTVRSCEVASDVMLSIDLSGSMNNDGGDPPEPISSVIAAAESFVRQLASRDQVGVVGFASEAVLLSELTNNHSRVGEIIASLGIDPEEERGNTHTGDGIRLSAEELTSSRHNENARKVMILLTDGKATAPGDETAARTYAEEEAVRAKEADVEVFTIGLGENVDRQTLSVLATDRAHEFFTADRRELESIYTSISSALCEDGPAVIEVIVKTPGDLFSELR